MKLLINLHPEDTLFLVVQDTIVLPASIKNIKHHAVYISILLEASSVKDNVGLTTQRKMPAHEGMEYQLEENRRTKKSPKIFLLFHFHNILDISISLRRGSEG